MQQAVAIQDALAPAREVNEGRFTVGVMGGREYEPTPLHSTPERDLPGYMLRHVMIVDVSIGVFHPSDQAGPTWMEEPYPWETSIFAIQPDDSHAVKHLLWRLALIVGQHAYL